MHFPTLRLRSFRTIARGHRGNSPATTASTARTSVTTSSTNRDRSPSTSSTKSTFSSRTTIYPIDPPPAAYLELPWRYRRSSRGALRDKCMYPGDDYEMEDHDGEVEVLEPRPERVYVKGLWEAMMMSADGPMERGRAL